MLRHLFFLKDAPTKFVLFSEISNPAYLMKSLSSFLYSNLYGNAQYLQSTTVQKKSQFEMSKIKLIMFQIQNFMLDVQNHLVKCESKQMEMVNESITKSQVHINHTR